MRYGTEVEQMRYGTEVERMREKKRNRANERKVQKE